MNLQPPKNHLILKQAAAFVSKGVLLKGVYEWSKHSSFVPFQALQQRPQPVSLPLTMGVEEDQDLSQRYLGS